MMRAARIACDRATSSPNPEHRTTRLIKCYTALLTADLAKGEDWYTKLLGRGPDRKPMDTLLHWELFDHSGLMLSSSKEIAAVGVMFLYVENLTAERRRLQDLGIVSRQRQQGRLFDSRTGA